MNERIKALAEQAGEYAAQNATGDWEVGPDYQDLFNKKFAELIVSDVLSEVGKFIRRNPGYWDEYGLVTDIAPIYAGVEE